MSDDPTQTNPPTPTNEDEGKKQEDAYWKRLHSEMDTWFDAKVKSLRETGDSRTGGRTTLPGVLAKLLGGPFDPAGK